MARELGVVDPGFDVSTVVFRPPDGRELLVRSYGRDGVGSTCSTARQPSSNADPVDPSDDPVSDLTAAYSPDGRMLAFRRWDPNTDTYEPTSGRLTIASSADAVAAAADVWYVGRTAWSNGGDRIAFQQRHRDTGQGKATRVAILDAGDRGDREDRTRPCPTIRSRAWSPDDQQILLFSGDERRPLLLDPAGGTVTRRPLGRRNYPSWRRCAR